MKKKQFEFNIVIKDNDIKLVRSSLSILFLIIICQVSSSQTLHYDVIKGSKTLGNMSVERVEIENGEKYEIKSEVTFRLLFSFTVDYESTSEYRHGRLIKEYTHNELNGSTQKKSTVWFDGEKYTLDLNGSRSTFKNPIRYSVATIYFREPHDGQRVYSPQFGDYLTFLKVNQNQYELESPDGLNLYTYTNGVCSEVKVSRDFAKFYFKMTPESLKQVKDKAIIGGAPVVD